MKQIWIARAGGPEVLEVREAPDPEPAEGQVRVRVAASGVNFADLMARIGLYPDAPKVPCVVGYEVAGTVDRVGPGVTGVAVGDRVVALTRFGGYSDVVCVPRTQVVPIGAGLGFEAAAAVPVNYLTAWIMLVTLGNVRAGETVLVHAAAGGVGQAALQICKQRGARVIGTASASKHARLREAGVAETIDYTTQDFQAEVARLTAGRGVDIVLDAVGGASFRKSYESLAPLGRLFIFGGSAFSSGERRSIPTILKAFLAMPSYKPFTLMNDNRGVFGVNLGHLWGETERTQAILRELIELVDQGVLAPVIDKIFPFAEAGAAHGYLAARKNFGKVLLRP
jgi:NADPH:quinone reductase-like Zn-dependent oxidoreductase